jgi:hypothetical protein
VVQLRHWVIITSARLAACLGIHSMGPQLFSVTMVVLAHEQPSQLKSGTLMSCGLLLALHMLTLDVEIILVHVFQVLVCHIASIPGC